jgi:hypothetical protein
LGVLCAIVFAAAPEVARAEGFFDFLFGGFHQRQAPPQVNSYAEPSAPVLPAPLGSESVRQGGGSTGRTVAFCVRLCDGQNFPLERMTNATPIETCRTMCPASKTKVFFGSEVGGAVARDGAHYADLDNAFVYRKHLVANCTCNGRDAFGLAPYEMASDPTLRPGDIVVTEHGPVAYTGGRGQAAAYTPVDPAKLNAQLNPASGPVRVSRRAEPQLADDEPGTIVRSQSPQPQNLPPVVDLRGQPR